MRIVLMILIFISYIYSYEITTGWNLVGTSENINILSNDKLSDASVTESIWKYENSGWSYYIAGATSNTLTDLNSGDGFWLKSKTNYTSPFITAGGDSFTFDIKVGWNLLSAKNGKDFSASSLNVDNTWVYRNSGWLLYPKYANIDTFTTVKAGEGTFIYSTSAKTVTVSSSDAPPSVPTVSTSTSTSSSTSTSTSSSANAYSGAEINGESYTLLAWTDLGMHCLDDDFSIFSILPPYSNLRAQLIDKNNNNLITSGVTLTFEATSKDGKINSTSENKTNFWDYVQKLFNSVLGVNEGLAGNKVQSLTPQAMTLMGSYFEAEGIPATPYNDDGTKDTYPMVRVVAKDSSGNVLATTKTVLPVSDEMDCRACHSSTSNYSDAKPSSGWENNSNSTVDYRLNILKLHDEKHNISAYLDEVKSKGYEYSDSLYNTAKSGTPILCVVCHKSNALKTSGVGSIPQFTTAMHSLHATVKHPTTGTTLGDTTSKDTCYLCHPGSETKCLRGAMNGINCQECHGGLNAVGSYHREGWVDLPNCQNCHQDGQRYTTAVTDSMGTLRDALDDRFSTGTALYKNATGHGGLNCQACHGATHAVYPSIKAEDNYQSIQLMGNEGIIGDCAVCHKSVPFTTNSGPHGMHSISQSWVNSHGHYAESSTSSCKACHGSDLTGSDLSKTLTDRTFSTEWGTKSFSKGTKISCSSCHGGIVSTSSSTSTSTSMHATTQEWVNTHKSTARYSTETCKTCHGSDLTGSSLSTTTSDRTFSTEWGTKSFSKGTQISCSSCHGGIVSTSSSTTSSTSSSMHATTQQWVNSHEDIAKRSTESCKSCHGSDLTGSSLSTTTSDRTFSTEWGTKSFSKGTQISCSSCHGGIVSSGSSESYTSYESHHHDHDDD